jgi:Ca2+-binding EF-hand superfamily protein
MKISRALLALLVLFLFPRCGWAQQQPDPNAMFERLDQNGDGVLTSEEVPEERQRFFDRMMQRADQNQDGNLTREEFTASMNDGGGGRGPMRGGRFDAESMFERFDSNGDGEITQDEIPQRAQRMMQMDQNGDGVLTREELSQGPPGRGPGGRPGRAPGGLSQGSGDLVGQPLPDIAVYDAQGGEFKLSSLKGDYSVLVFGCLT